MKKLLLALGLALSLSAHAESWVMPNNGGGEITLTKRQCEYNGKVYGNLNEAYTWSNQVFIPGCWSVVDGNVHIVWAFADGSSARNVYPITRFTRRP
jgi:hypothetical protein